MTTDSILREKDSDEKKSGKGLFRCLIDKCLIGLTFLLPVFWSPFASSTYEFGKHQLLVLLGSIAFLAWSAKVVLQDKKISLRLNLLDLSVLLFLLMGIVSTVFSFNPYISLFGSYGDFSNGFIALLFFGVVYFLVRAADSSETGFSVKSLLKTFFVSFSVVLLVALFSVLGLGNKFGITYATIQQKIFNTVSFSLEGLSVFVATVMVLLTGVITCSQLKKEKLLKVLLFSSLVLLIIVDIIPAWIVLFSGLTIFTVLALMAGSFKRDIHQLLLPIFLIIISVLFFFIDLGNEGFLSFPQEQYLGQQFSYEVAVNTIQEGPKQTFIGSGLGTWANDFLKNRSVKFNEESLLWGSRLNKAGNYISELMATMGVCGLVVYAAMIGFSFYGFFLTERKKRALPYIAALSAVLAGQFVYYQNTALGFLAWFILGLGAVAWKEALAEKFAFKKTLSSERLPELNLAFSVMLILLSLSVMAGFYFSAKEALADYYYVEAQKSGTVQDMIANLEEAISQDPYRVNYRTLLSQAYLSQAIEEYGKPAEEQDMMMVQGKINQILNQLSVLERDFGKNVAAWETIGLIRRDVQGDLKGAIKAFEKALELDKKNPGLYTEIGKLYAGMGDLDKARENYQKAKELKSNYFNVYLLDALSYEEDSPEKAIEELEKAEEKFPNVTELKYQLGRLYYNQEDFDLAISYFIETIQLSPNHSNAYYYLGLAYEEKGNTEVAVAALEKVLELNPDNQQIKDKIDELKTEVEE